MNAPNRPHLGDLPTMPIGEIAASPAAVLALLQDEAEEASRAARHLADWLNGAIALRYGDRAAAARRAEGKDTGAVRFDDDEVMVIADLPKKVDWDQAELATLVSAIRPNTSTRSSTSPSANTPPGRATSASPSSGRAR